MRDRAVAIIIDRAARAVLLIHRWNQGREYYVLPGGKIEEWETPDETATREAREETGLTITLERPVATLNNMGRTEYYFLAVNFSGVLAIGWPEMGRALPDNTYELEWVPVDRLFLINLKPEAIQQVVAACILEQQA